MEVHYKTPKLHGIGENYNKPTVEEFTISQLLHKEGYSGDRERVRLEQQPENVAKALGGLLNLLLEKGIILPEDFHNIVDTDWVLRDKCEILKDNS